MSMSTIRLTYEVEKDDLARAGEASSQVKQTLRKLGFDPETIRRVAICMYEGEINMVIHADGGQATVDIGLDAITIVLADHGPGIPDVDLAMQAGYTTAGEAVRDLGFGAGMGLPNMKKYSDSLTIDTTVGVGTTVTMIILIPQ
jgi:serine/threonine-protein kinase RsbT